MTDQKHDYTQVLNHCTHFIHLPPSESFPDGHRLVPGSNNVPTAYLLEIADFEVPERSEHGQQGKIGLFESFARPSKASANRPQVVVMNNISADAEEGPPAPFDLSEYKEELALKIVEITKDKDALKRWSKDSRDAVATAAKKKAGGK